MKHLHMKTCRIVVASITILLTVHRGAAQRTGETGQAGHPALGDFDAVDNQTASDRAVEQALYESQRMKPYFEWKTQIEEGHGFTLGADYSALRLNAIDTLPSTFSEASSGIARFFGTWTTLGID